MMITPMMTMMMKLELQLQQ